MSQPQPQSTEQRTQEWRQARVGMITASRVGGILGHSPYSSPARVLREMVREANGVFEELSGPQIRWGNDNEEAAVESYSYFWGAGSTLAKAGFEVSHEVSYLGASPDRFVDSNGLLEVKCPYGIRDDDPPFFKSIGELPHYMDQIQLQLMVTGRLWCDFYQWAPHGAVPRGPERPAAVP